MITKALLTAIEFHGEQKCWSGQPYWTHLVRVCQRVTSKDGKIVGLLHDIIEDTPCTYMELSHRGFEDRQLDAIRVLTRPKYKHDYFEYLDKVINHGALSIEVKLADVEDHLDVLRDAYCVEWTKDRCEKIEKYSKALKILRSKYAIIP